MGDLPLGDGWDEQGGVLVKEGNGWLVNVFEPEEADSSEAPAELQAAASDLSYRVEISLEPSGAPDDGVATLNSAVEALGAALGGAAVDPSTGRVRTWP